MSPTDRTTDNADTTPDAIDDRDVDELRRQVAAAVSRTCPAWLARQADDIAQNVMIQLVASLRRGVGASGFSRVYLAKAAYGATMDEIRRHARRRESPDGETIVGRAASRATNPEREASSGEIVRAIQDCLALLSRPRKLAVTMYLQGCSVPETAQTLRWKRKRAENYVFRGLADLRRCLSGKGFQP